MVATLIDRVTLSHPVNRHKLASALIANAQAIIAAINGGNSNCCDGCRGTNRGYDNSADKVLGANQDFKIFPNPATDAITIDLIDIRGTAELSVIDPFGKTVSTQRIEDGQTEVTLNLLDNQFSSGVYFVRLRTENQQLSQRLVIAK